MREESVTYGRFLREVYVKPGPFAHATERNPGEAPVGRLTYYMLRTESGEAAPGQKGGWRDPSERSVTPPEIHK